MIDLPQNFADPRQRWLNLIDFPHRDPKVLVWKEFLAKTSKRVMSANDLSGLIFQNYLKVDAVSLDAEMVEKSFELNCVHVYLTS